MEPYSDRRTNWVRSNRKLGGVWKLIERGGPTLIGIIQAAIRHNKPIDYFWALCTGLLVYLCVWAFEYFLLWAWKAPEDLDDKFQKALTAAENKGIGEASEIRQEYEAVTARMTQQLSAAEAKHVSQIHARRREIIDNIAQVWQNGTQHTLPHQWGPARVGREFPPDPYIDEQLTKRGFAWTFADYRKAEQNYVQSFD